MAGSLRFTPASGGGARSLSSSPAFSVLYLLQREGLSIRHDCGGKALCGTCRVSVAPGSRGLSPMEERERARLLDAGQATDGSVRLACQLRVAGEAVLAGLLKSEEAR